MRAVNKSKKGLIISCIIIGSIIIGGLVFAYIYFDKNAQIENQVFLSDTTFEVKGYFPAVYDYDDVVSIELIDTLPTVIEKLKGIALGKVKKGDFEMDGLGVSRLHVLTNDGPYIKVEFENSHLIFDHLDKSLTDMLYNELSDKINN